MQRIMSIILRIKKISFLFIGLILFIIYNLILKAGNEKKEINMEYIKIENIKLKKVGKDSIFSMNICNKYSENIYFYKLFIPNPDSNIIWTFLVSQDGKKIKYKGARAKIKMMKFPNGYVAIEPNKCLPIRVKLNKYFDFDQDKEVEVEYFRTLKCPSCSKENININFTKTLLSE